MYPHERSLVSRLKDKPFALLGVNADGEGRGVVTKIREAQLPWRYWIETAENRIGPSWGVAYLPTLFLIDRKGVVRQRFDGSVEPKTLDRAIDALLAETPGTS
jgi:hypothetical protein